MVNILFEWAVVLLIVSVPAMLLMVVFMLDEEKPHKPIERYLKLSVHKFVPPHLLPRSWRFEYGEVDHNLLSYLRWSNALTIISLVLKVIANNWCKQDEYSWMEPINLYSILITLHLLLSMLCIFGQLYILRNCDVLTILSILWFILPIGYRLLYYTDQSVFPVSMLVIFICLCVVREKALK